MRSFSTTSYPSDDAAALAQAEKTVADDPFALFTDFQWFLLKARNTVYFTAFSEESYTLERLRKFTAELTSLAPQLTHGFAGAHPGQPFARHILDAIVSLEEVDSFEGYPDKWLEPGQDLFNTKDLPLFRVKIAARRGGADAQGRASMILVRSSHALMEGSDSALLANSQFSGHGTMNTGGKKVPLLTRLRYLLIASILAPMHMASAHLLSPAPEPMEFRSLSMSRQRIRGLASRLGVRQRAVVFALAMYAINDGGKGLSAKTIKTAYTMLDTERHDLDDEFFRVRVIEAPFEVKPKLVDFIRAVDAKVNEIEAKDLTRMHFITTAMFKVHRTINRFLPFLYNKRFFNYAGGYHMTLTMIPPHRMVGPLVRGMKEPVYCGSYHSGSNLCTFVPSREFVTLNFCVRGQHTSHIDTIPSLLDTLEAETANEEAQA